MPDYEGPLMLAATDVLKPPPARIATLGRDIALPRSVQVRSVAAAVGGMIVGLPLELLALSVIGLQGLVVLVVLCAGGGVVLVQWQPQKGETLLQILGVRTKTRLRQTRIEVDGQMMSLSIGVARISRVAAGEVAIRRGSIEVDPNSVDERGVIRSAKNRNLVSLIPAVEFPSFPDADTRLAMPDAIPPAPAPLALEAAASAPWRSAPVPFEAPETPQRPSRLAMPDGHGGPPAEPAPVDLVVASMDVAPTTQPAREAAPPATRRPRVARRSRDAEPTPPRLMMPDAEPAAAGPPPTPAPPSPEAPGRPSRLTLPD